MVDFAVRCSPPDPGQRVIEVQGEVDMRNADKLTCLGKAALAADGSVETLVIDLSRVTFMDSTGVGALIDIHAAATRAGVSVRIRDAPPVVARILQITGLAPMFRLESDGDRAHLSSRDDLG